MNQRCCRFCQREFALSRFHPEQTACSGKACQQQRRSQNRSQILALDAEYRQVCRDSARKWRANHAGYWQQYRAAKPESVQRNRSQQRQRDLRQRLANLANNNSALDPKVFRGRDLVVGPKRQRSCKQQLGFHSSLYSAKLSAQTAAPGDFLQTTTLWFAGRPGLILQTRCTTRNISNSAFPCCTICSSATGPPAPPHAARSSSGSVPCTATHALPSTSTPARISSTAMAVDTAAT